MINLWLALAGLLLVAFLFVAWPLWRHRHTFGLAAINDAEINQRLAENVRIFREHLQELENSFAAKAIEEKQFAQLKVELERNLLDDEASLRALNTPSSQKLGVKAAIVFCALVLLGGVFFYQKHGSADDVEIYVLQTEKMQQEYKNMLVDTKPDPALARELIEKFQARLKAQPDNLQYWFLLARTQLEVGSYGDAVKSYQQLLTLDSKSAMIMSELAQAMFLRDGNQMTPAVVDLARNALTLEPKNTIALGLLGMDAYIRKDYRETIRYWQKSVDILGPESSSTQAISSGIQKAKESYVAAGGKLEDLLVKSPYTIKLEVSLGAKPKVTQDQVVFVYARAWQGSPMPLAIARIKVKDLPTTIQLDETMAMSPAASLATAADVEVVARVSPSGSAKAEVGDWLAKQGPISMKSVPQVIQLEINEQFTGDAAKP